MAERARLFLDRMATPIGELLLVVDEADQLCATDWGEKEIRLRTRYPALQDRRSKAADALRAYFAGELAAIDKVPVATSGTEFQECVWHVLRGIACGTVTTYAALAQRIGRPTAIRAVGLANGSNPISVVVPCHRVIGSNGTLTGYGGGLERKRWLLAHEQVTLA
ncbi:MAG: methylated-DNA--[protein]-cysteine S-methyltransferase [Rhodospirillales bacterium]|nr:methylated-DNA--[protein]-cysteine S-methyltransferase [Rhodospirillales bacterium]